MSVGASFKGELVDSSQAVSLVQARRATRAKRSALCASYRWLGALSLADHLRSHAVDYRLPQSCVNVAGINAVWQSPKPSLHFLGVEPLCEDQVLGLTQRGIETVRAKGLTAGDAVDRDPAQDGCELEGDCFEWLRKSCERLGLETFDIDFDEFRLAIAFDQFVQGDRRSDEPAGPTLTTPAGRRRRRRDKA